MERHVSSVRNRILFGACNAVLGALVLLDDLAGLGR